MVVLLPHIFVLHAAMLDAQVGKHEDIVFPTLHRGESLKHLDKGHVTEQGNLGENVLHQLNLVLILEFSVIITIRRRTSF
jgi:hypothetical protein